ncbi:MAG: riboflavin synthase [Acidobacteriota bacterium]
MGESTMFSGIVFGRARVESLTPQEGGQRLGLSLPAGFPPFVAGASIAVAGTCLTAREDGETSASFDVIEETLRKTRLGELAVGSPVNVEASLRMGDPIDGHVVQGHVDGLGRVSAIETEGGEHVYWIEPPSELAALIAPRGSIAIDGVSLTVARWRESSFAVALIPTTLELTTLGELKVGDAVNLETDILARQVAHWLERREG